MSEEKKDYSEGNKKGMILALVTQFAQDLGISIKKILGFDQLAEPLKKFGETIIQAEQALQDSIKEDEPLTPGDFGKAVSQFSQNTLGTKFMRIVTWGDERVCEKCKPWNGRIVSVDEGVKGYPSVQDWIDAGAAHFGCRCSLQELSTIEIPRQKPNPRAYNNSSTINGKIVFI